MNDFDKEIIELRKLIDYFSDLYVEDDKYKSNLNTLFYIIGIIVGKSVGGK